MGAEALMEIFAGLVAAVAIVGFLATAAEAVVEGLISPIWKRYKLDGFWLMYIAWAVAFGLVMLSRINLFADFIPGDTVALVWVGRVLTAIIAGRGSNFLHNLFSVKRSQMQLNRAMAAETDDAFYKMLLDTDWREAHILGDAVNSSEE